MLAASMRARLRAPRHARAHAVGEAAPRRRTASPPRADRPARRRRRPSRAAHGRAARAGGGSARRARRRPRSGRRRTRRRARGARRRAPACRGRARPARHALQRLLERARGVGGERRRRSRSSGRSAGAAPRARLGVDRRSACAVARERRGPASRARRPRERSPALEPRRLGRRGRSCEVVLGLEARRARRWSSARRVVRVTTIHSGLAGEPGSMRFVRPAVSQATAPGLVRTTRGARRSVEQLAHQRELRGDLAIRAELSCARSAERRVDDR